MYQQLQRGYLSIQHLYRPAVVTWFLLCNAIISTTSGQVDDPCEDLYYNCYCYQSGSEYRAVCSDERMTFVPNDLPFNITELEISYSGFEELTSGNLSFYDHLYYVYMVNNEGLTTIENGAFNGLPQITNIQLTFNQISTIEEGTFAGLTNLRDLNLNDNDLTSLPPLNGVTSLVELKIENNQIEALPTNAFGSNTDLGWLYLSNNAINTVQVNAFSQLTSLEILYLDNNEIASLSSDVFAGLSSLVQLSLSNNRLTSLPANVFTGIGDQCQLLDLSYNQIGTIDENAFAGLSGLNFLNLNYNDLLTVPTDALSKITSLTDLSLSGNRFTVIEDFSFEGLQSLSALNIGLMETLTELSLNAFSRAKITSLSLFGNPELTEFTKEHLPDAEHEDLVTLIISDNGFSLLNEDIFANKTALKQVDLYGNPFHCDCKLKWMPRVYLDGVVWASGWGVGNPIFCGSPGHLEGFEILNMRDLDFTCQKPELSGPVKIEAHLHSDITIQATGHHGIPSTWWVSPSGIVYYPLRTAPQGDDIDEWLPSQSIEATEHYNKTNDENIVIASLHLSNVTLADDGIYQIWASNHLDNTSITIELEVLPYELTTLPVPITTSPISSAITSFSCQPFLLMSSIFLLHFLMNIK